MEPVGKIEATYWCREATPEETLQIEAGKMDVRDSRLEMSAIQRDCEATSTATQDVPTSEQRSSAEIQNHSSSLINLTFKAAQKVFFFILIIQK